MSMSCAICGHPVAPRDENTYYPLCSERCRLVDLGKWLGEGYAIPGPPTNDFGAPDFAPEEEEP